MEYQVTLLPEKVNISVPQGTDLLTALRSAGVFPDAPCGGAGKCGKCRVTVDGREVLACRTPVDRDMTVVLPQNIGAAILTGGLEASVRPEPVRPGYLLAFDVGTTTVVGYLLDGKTGGELAAVSAMNPQTAWGADVISRIQAALKGAMEELTDVIRACLGELTEALCRRGGIGPEEVSVVSIVGNPAMQQLFLGLSPENLAKIPFAPVLTRAEVTEAAAYLPHLSNAGLLVVPDISGFVGADTVACVLATGMDRREEMTLLVDIGTNGEMVMGNRHRMVACSTAAGPALEGANIRFGMRGMAGAIDHVTRKDGKIVCSVIGGTEPQGICGSGLIDAVAAALELGLINSRGRIQNESRRIPLTEQVFLTQEDIREIQLAKGAIAAGIRLMAKELGITMEQIDRVYLAGAFGSYMDPESACRMGLLPPELAGKITAVGNAAGAGAKMLALSRRELQRAEELVRRIEFLELAALEDFQGAFARCMRF